MTQEYIGQLQITNSLKDFSIDGNAASLTAGTYYIEGYTGEGGQLIEHMETVIRALHADYDSGGSKECSITRARNTGKISISFASGPVAIVWTDTGLGALLGYDGDLSGESAYVATYTPKSVWRPTRSLTDYPGDLTTWWGKRSTSKITISRDGSTYGQEGVILYDGLYTYENLPESDTVETSSSVWTTLESFWENVVHEVRPIRVLPDDSSYGSGDYVTGMLLPIDAENDGNAVKIGHFREYINNGISNYRGLWDINFKMAKYVTA